MVRAPCGGKVLAKPNARLHRNGAPDFLAAADKVLLCGWWSRHGDVMEIGAEADQDSAEGPFESSATATARVFIRAPRASHGNCTGVGFHRQQGR
jgi:hypothetical protein